MCELNVFLQFHLTLDKQTHSTSVKCVLNWGGYAGTSIKVPNPMWFVVSFNSYFLGNFDYLMKYVNSRNLKIPVKSRGKHVAVYGAV